MWSQVPGELKIRIFSDCDPSSLGRVLCVSLECRKLAAADRIWRPLCEDVGLKTEGSSRPGSRTYTPWLQVWGQSRCANCFGLYKFKVNLDGGSFAASTHHGAKIALCEDCAEKAAECYYRMSEQKTLAFQLLPRLVAVHGLSVALTCGNNVPITETAARKKRRLKLPK